MRTMGRFQFSDDWHEMWIDTAEPERRVDNMLYNRAYFTMIDQCGGGLGKHMTADGYENNVVSNQRAIYIRDDESGEYFSAGFAPVFKAYTSYRCISGLNYSILENVTNGLKVTWRIFIPAGDDPLEVWDVRVENVSGRARKVSVFTCVEMQCDGVDTYGGPLYRLADFLPESDAIFIRCDAPKFEEIDFPLHNGFFAASRTPQSWDAGMGPFLGDRRGPDRPLAVESGRCSNKFASMFPPNGGMHFALDLGADAAEDLRFLIGACGPAESIQPMREKYLGGRLDACAVFDALASERAERMRNIQVETGDPTFDMTLNVWGKQQSHYLATWCRWGYMGFRDIVQMSQGVLYWDAALAKENLRRALRHQYADGFALRGWNPLDPMRYVDCASWMIAAVMEYVKETGDLGFFDETLAFLDEGEATVYEHLSRIMVRLHIDRGAHGLCLAFFGDWNDSLTGVCREGRGESVWMSMAFCRYALLMEELAEELGRTDDAERMRLWHGEMADAINRHAWDGDWYMCALDDDGEPIGSSKNDEGKLFLNMQSWAQLGGVCDDSRWERAIASVDRHLETGWGPMLNWPVYTKPKVNVGRLSYIRPGVCENASVYSHGIAFLVLAYLERGLADRALDLWHTVHPSNPDRPVEYQPNAFVNGFWGPDSDIQPGFPEHAWTTGSASWLLANAIEHFFGLRRGFDGLTIRPCLPSAWESVSIERIYRGTTYRVRLSKTKGVENPPVRRIRVDGAEHPLDAPLPLDSGAHDVVVEL